MEASRPLHVQPLYHWEKAPGTNLIGSCVDSTACLDVVEPREISVPAENQTPVIKLVA
jgi:hypothetical protein